jgi:hypothetical protein
MKGKIAGNERLPIAYRGLADRLNGAGPDRLYGDGGPLDRLVAEGRRLQAMLDRAVPPEVMAEMPVAPARGPMAIEPEYLIDRQGFRRIAGYHAREVLVLELICLRAQERHKARAGKEAFVSPFSWHQIAIAGDYRELVKWRAGAPIKGSKLEGGRSGGGGSGLFIETYIDQGRALAVLEERIGRGVALEAGEEGRRAGRRDIGDRELLDAVVLSDMQLPAVLRAFGWSDGGRVKARAQEALRRILDRMLGATPENEGA